MARTERDDGGDRLGTASAAETALQTAVDGTVTDVEWWAHRLLGPEERAVEVYRGAVLGGEHDGYFVVVDERGGPGEETVYPADAVDSVADLFATYRADTDADVPG